MDKDQNVPILGLQDKQLPKDEHSPSHLDPSATALWSSSQVEEPLRDSTSDPPGLELSDYEDESNGFQKIKMCVTGSEKRHGCGNDALGRDPAPCKSLEVKEVSGDDGSDCFYTFSTLKGEDLPETDLEESISFQTVQVRTASGLVNDEQIPAQPESDTSDGCQLQTTSDNQLQLLHEDLHESPRPGKVDETNFSVSDNSPHRIEVDETHVSVSYEPPGHVEVDENNLSGSDGEDIPSLSPPLLLRSSDGTSLRHRINAEPTRSTSSGRSDNSDPDEEITPKGSKEKYKVALIRAALDSNPVDVMALRRLAISPGGLVNKNMRQRVWPLLISASLHNIEPKPSQDEMQAMTKTYNQVVMDVNRSSSRFPPGIDDHVRMSMKDKLVDLIMRVMLKNPQLKYYQGFHDVCITFLLCMDEDLAFAMVDKLALGHMREYLDESMERTQLLLNYIYPLVNKCNPDLCAHMQKCELGTIFALSWVITWFSHVLGDIHRILRVFDFFLASHRMMPVYLSAAFVLHREEDIYAVGDEMGYIHKCLSTIPTDLPLESLLQRAGDLYLQYPPTELSQDPMLLQLNSQVYEHFNRMETREAARRRRDQEPPLDRGRLFVKATMWVMTAAVGVAVAVLYHNYLGEEWSLSHMWGSSYPKESGVV